MEFIGILSKKFLVVRIFYRNICTYGESFSGKVFQKFLKTRRDFNEIILKMFWEDFENFLEKLGTY